MNSLIETINGVLSTAQNVLAISLSNEQQKLDADALNELLQSAQTIDAHRIHVEKTMAENELSGEDLEYVYNKMRENNNG